MSDEFCYLLRVRYSECDAQKVVFNAKYAEYVDVAATEFMRAIWGSYDELVASGIDTQVVKLLIEWAGPAHFDEVLAIKIKPLRIGTTSYTLQVDFYHYGESKKIATAEIIYVMVSAVEHIKMEIPADMRMQLEQGAPGVLIDHAGAKCT